MKATILGLLAVGLLASMSTVAAPITISSGESYTFNFDFQAAGLNPAPPYLSVVFNANVPAGDCCAGDVGTFAVFGDLNGADPLGTYNLESNTILRSLFFPNVISDGIFSVRLSMTSGSVTVNPLAYGVARTANTRSVFWDESVRSVPEPSALLLVGFGLAGLCLSRRRKAS